MYNTDFQRQLDKARQAIFGSQDPRELPNFGCYHLPPGIKTIKCKEDINGEWVPDLEEVISE